MNQGEFPLPFKSLALSRLENSDNNSNLVGKQSLEIVQRGNEEERSDSRPGCYSPMNPGNSTFFKPSTGIMNIRNRKSSMVPVLRSMNLFSADRIVTAMSELKFQQE